MNKEERNQKRKIEKKKGDVCPCCLEPLRAKNNWVIFHIRYGKNQIVILTCKYCNYTEYALRNKIDLDTVKCATPNRIYQVKNLMSKFNIKI